MARESTLITRIHKSDKEEFSEWIEKSEFKNTSDFLLAVVRTVIGKQLLIDEELKAELRITNQHLIKIGINLNQLTKAYNEGKITVPVNTAPFFSQIVDEIMNTKNVVSRLIASADFIVDLERK